MGRKDEDVEVVDRKKNLPAEGSPPVIAGLHALSGRDLLNGLLDRESPGEIVRGLSCEDFYWALKRIGEDDCLPLLALASEEQWQFMLDLELWKEDRLDNLKSFQWISRLRQADILRLARWLLSEGQALGYIYLFRNLQVEVNTDEEPLLDLQDGFMTLDGVYYFRPLDRKQSPEFESLLRGMAAEDLLRFQGVLSGLAGLIPAEAEEEMYRIRNVRLAEHGFLPREEALSVYTPLPPSAAVRGADKSHRTAEPDPEFVREAAVAPLMMAPAAGLFSEVAFSIDDPVLLDRMRLEFSGLCNLIMSADGVIPEDVKDLEKVCRRAAGYLNVALEYLCGESIPLAKMQVRDTALLTLFRIGFGLTVELGRRARGWIKDSWYSACGLSHRFWGDQWGENLRGILQSRGHYPSGAGDEGDFRGFRNIRELNESESILKRIIALDCLLGELFPVVDFKSSIIPGCEITVQAVLITSWARKCLGGEFAFSPVSPEEAGRFLAMLKGVVSGKGTMGTARRNQFISFFLERSSGVLKSCEGLEEALADVWTDFYDEYRDVRVEDPDPRFSRLLVIES